MVDIKVYHFTYKSLLICILDFLNECVIFISLRYITWTAWRLNSPTSWIFVEQHVKLTTKETSNPAVLTLYEWIFLDRLIPLTEGQWCKMCFHVMTLSWYCQVRILLSERFWLGASELINDGTWVWNSTGHTTASFSDWCIPDAQPNNVGGEDCLGLRRCPQPGGTEFAWFDETCNDQQSYICELMWRVGAI